MSIKTDGDMAKAVAGLIAIMVSVVFIIGWCINAYKLIKCDFEPSYKAEAIRAIGVVVMPVGGIAGYMDIGQ